MKRIFSIAFLTISLAILSLSVAFAKGTEDIVDYIAIGGVDYSEGGEVYLKSEDGALVPGTAEDYNLYYDGLGYIKLNNLEVEDVKFLAELTNEEACFEIELVEGSVNEFSFTEDFVSGANVLEVLGSVYIYGDGTLNVSMDMSDSTEWGFTTFSAFTVTKVLTLKDVTLNINCACEATMCGIKANAAVIENSTMAIELVELEQKRGCETFGIRTSESIDIKDSTIRVNLQTSNNEDENYRYVYSSALYSGEITLTDCIVDLSAEYTAMCSALATRLYRTTGTIHGRFWGVYTNDLLFIELTSTQRLTCSIESLRQEGYTIFTPVASLDNLLGEGTRILTPTDYHWIEIEKYLGNYTVADENGNPELEVVFAGNADSVVVEMTEGGTTSWKEGDYAVFNSDYTITFTPDEGYEIKDVTLNGESVGAVSTYTVEKVSGELNFTVTFEKMEEKEPGASEEEKEPGAPDDEEPETGDLSTTMFIVLALTCGIIVLAGKKVQL